MSQSNEITVNAELFRKLFPYFASLSDEQIEFASAGAGTYINTIKGAINLPLRLQERGVYLATAHILLTDEKNSEGGGYAGGIISSASEDGVSSSFKTDMTTLEYVLSKTNYGQELLIILKQVQPLMPRRPNNIYPYYSR